MDLIEVFEKDICRINIKVREKEQVLKAIAESAAQSAQIGSVHKTELFQSLKDREEQGSTGFGEGIAIPHARFEGLDGFILFIITSDRGVDFQSLDGKKTHILFVILAPHDRVNEHLKILAAVSRLLSTPAVKREILSCKSHQALYETLVRHTGEQSGKKKEVVKMRLLYVILYFEDYLYEMLEYFLGTGIEGASIVESRGMGSFISDIPIFASFINFMQEDKNQSHTIMALIPEDREAEIVKGIEKITGDLDVRQGATVISTEVAFYKGSMKMM